MLVTLTFFLSNNYKVDSLMLVKNSVGGVVTLEGVLGNIQIADNPVMDVLKLSSFDKYLGM